MLFDLDPFQVPFARVAEIALVLKQALDLLGLDSFAMTTGGEGLHVRVPVARRHSYEQVREFCRTITDAVARSSAAVTTERAPARRRGVFVDTKMNGHGQQIISPYSVRPLPGAAVAAPLAWREVDESLDPTLFTIHVVRERVERDGDLLAPVLTGRQRLGPALARVG